MRAQAQPDCLRADCRDLVWRGGWRPTSHLLGFYVAGKRMETNKIISPGSMTQGRVLYACGFNGFRQLPLQDRELHSSRQVTSPGRCIDCPTAPGGLASYVAVGWSRCLFRNGGSGQEILSHGFSSGSSDDRVVLRASSDIKAIRCVRGTCVALPSSSSGLLIEKSPNCLEHVQIDTEDGQNDVKIIQLDSDKQSMFAITDENQIGRIDKSEQGGSYLYRPSFTEPRVKALSCGKEHTLILTYTGEVFSLGSGSRGQLGHGTVEERVQAPTLIEGIAAVPMVTISAGGWHSAAVSEYGDLYIWGWNESGQLGCSMAEKRTRKRKASMDERPMVKDARPSSDYRKPEVPDEAHSSTHGSTDGPTQPVTFLMSPQLLDMAPPEEVLVQSVSCGSRHTAAVTRDGHLYTWGYGRWGQLGHGNEWTLDTPTEVVGVEGRVIDVHCREWNTFILTQKGVT